ncbi:MAG: phosphatidylglycerol lysyltransferase domain-containing protein [Cyanobacteria bacterium P01_H01_bin.121]
MRTRIGLRSAALLTGLVGVVNLLSAVEPSLPRHLMWLEQIFGLDVRVGARLSAAIAGFIMLSLATSLLRRKRVAWRIVLGLLIVSIVSHVIKGVDWLAIVLATILLVQLLIMRPLFTAQSDRPSVAQGLRVLVGALLFTLAYGTVGFYELQRHSAQPFQFWQAWQQTLSLFFSNTDLSNPNLSLSSLGRDGRLGLLFANSIYIVGACTLLYALWLLLHPVLRRQTASRAERQQASTIVESAGESSLAALTLLSDKSYYFTPTGQSVIAYVPKGRCAIALGDPIGPLSDRKAVLISFQEFCRRNDWHPAFYQTLPDHLDLYDALGFQAVKIGEEAIVDLKTFTLQGKPGRNHRSTLNKFKKLDITFQIYKPPIAAPLLKTLHQISNDWLKTVHGSEKRFSVGWFDESYLQACAIATVQTSNGEITAFANLLPMYQAQGMTADLMRYRVGTQPGTMDFLFLSIFQHLQAQGYEQFSLGLSALAGVGETEQATQLEKGLNYLYKHLDRFYSFQGLHAYKEKFHPTWQSRYLVFPNLVALPDVVVALVRADSGDRLLDYFKPGT